MDRQQFDGRHAERPDIVDDRLRPEPGIEAAQAFVHLGMQLGEALDVGFVDDRVVPGDAAAAVFAVPVEVGIDDGAFRHEGRAVALVEGQVVSFGADRVAEDGRVPGELAGVSAGVGVEQKLVRIEAMARLGLEWPVDAEAVKRAGPDAGDVAVKDFVGVFGQLEPVDLASVRRVEDADVDPRRMRGEDREIGAVGVGRRAERIGLAFADSHVRSRPAPAF